MLIAEIDSLSKNGEGCFASNAYLAEFFSVKEGTMADMLTDLRKLNRIENTSFNGRQRAIRIKNHEPKADFGENPNPEFAQSPNPHIGDNKGDITDCASRQPNLLPNTETASSSGKPDHQRFIDLWCQQYRKKMGMPYRFDGAKDGSAVKALLAIETPEELVRVAEMAWSHPTGFNCKLACTIAGFNGRFNEIAAEAKTAYRESRKP